MKTKMVRLHRLMAILCGALVLSAAHAALAGTINYSDLFGSGFVITNISESNTLAGNVALYGAPSLTADGTGIVFNTSTNPFTANAANGGSASLSGTLNFTLIYINPPQDSPNLTVTETGTFAGVGDSSASVTPTLMLFDSSDNLITSVTGSITPTSPFSGGSGDTQAAFTWQGAANASSSGVYTSFNVVLNNDLTAVSMAQGASAQVDKKLITIELCPDCTGATPEPASIGLLGLGVSTLLLRRRKI